MDKLTLFLSVLSISVAWVILGVTIYEKMELMLSKRGKQPKKWVENVALILSGPIGWVILFFEAVWPYIYGKWEKHALKVGDILANILGNDKT